MKKLICLFLVMGTLSLSAQEMKSMSDAANSMTSDSMIDQLADTQIKSLAKQFNLSDAQAEQASAVVKEVMKSPKFTEMLGKYSPEKLMGSKGTDMIQGALLGDNSFMKGMKGVVSEDQMGEMVKAASALK